MSQRNSQIVQAWDIPSTEVFGTLVTLEFSGSSTQAWDESVNIDGDDWIRHASASSVVTFNTREWDRRAYPYYELDEGGSYVEQGGGGFSFTSIAPITFEDNGLYAVIRPDNGAASGAFRGITEPATSLASGGNIGTFAPIMFNGGDVRTVDRASISFMQVGGIEETIEATYTYDGAADPPPPTPDPETFTRTYEFTLIVTITWLPGDLADVDVSLDGSMLTNTYPPALLLDQIPGFFGYGDVPTLPIAEAVDNVPVDCITKAGIADTSCTFTWTNNVAPDDGLTYSAYENSYTMTFTFAE